MELFRRNPKASGKQRRVVVLGASFAGLSAARNLGPELEVIVVDRRDTFEFTPNIHELISGFKRPDDLRIPLDPLILGMRHQFFRDDVLTVDLEAKTLNLSGRGTLEYDSLIVGIGGVDTTRGVEGVEQHAWPFKNIDQCAAIGRELHRQLNGFREARDYRVVIVGGGLEGIEALGEILRRYRHRRELSVRVVEARDRLLPNEPIAIDIELRRHCHDHGVELLFGARIARVNKNVIELDDGRKIGSDLTIWTGGVAPPPLLTDAGLAEEGKWAEVDSSLETRIAKDVFIVGDAARPPTRPSKQAYHGLDMGALCAENIRRRQRGQSLRNYEPSPKPTLIAFGDLDTFMVSKRFVIAGTALAPLKESVFQLVMSQLSPPVDPSSALGLATRLGRSAQSFLTPTFGSISSLVERPGVRRLKAA